MMALKSANIKDMKTFNKRYTSLFISGRRTSKPTTKDKPFQQAVTINMKIGKRSLPTQRKNNSNALLNLDEEEADPEDVEVKVGVVVKP